MIENGKPVAGRAYEKEQVQSAPIRAVRSAVFKQQLIVTYGYGAFEMCESE